MGSLAAVACLFCLFSPGLSHGAPPDALTVQVTMIFDPSRTTAATMRVLTHETEAIWNAYGVGLLWSDGRAARAALHLAVVVDRDRAAFDVDHAQPELAHTTLDRTGTARGPIQISLNTIETLIGREPATDPLLHNHELAIAAGRVLAHEIGHVLLGPPAYHDADGLMRPMFSAIDLRALNRGRFRLSASSVSRLRARLAVLSAPGNASGITPLLMSD